MLKQMFIEIASCVTGLKIGTKTAGIKKYKSIINKKKKIVLFTKFKLKNIQVLIAKALIDSNISHEEFVLIINVLKEYEEMKQEIKSSNNK